MNRCDRHPFGSQAASRTISTGPWLCAPISRPVCPFEDAEATGLALSHVAPKTPNCIQMRAANTSGRATTSRMKRVSLTTLKHSQTQDRIIRAIGRTPQDKSTSLATGLVPTPHSRCRYIGNLCQLLQVSNRVLKKFQTVGFSSVLVTFWPRNDVWRVAVGLNNDLARTAAQSLECTTSTRYQLSKGPRGRDRQAR